MNEFFIKNSNFNLLDFEKYREKDRGKFKNLIVGIFGELGSGKTLLLTLLGKYYYERGYKIYADYNLKIPFERVKTLEQVLNSDITQDSVFLFDELWVSADARQHGTHDNIELSKWALQSRKKRMSIFYSAQYPRLVEQRIRVITQFILKPMIIAYDENNSPVAMYIEKYARDIAGYVYPQGRILVNLDLRTVVNLYDTSEIVEPINVKSKYDYVIEEVISKLKASGKTNIKKRDIVSLLVVDYKFPMNRALVFSNYIVNKLQNGTTT